MHMIKENVMPKNEWYSTKILRFTPCITRFIACCYVRTNSGRTVDEQRQPVNKQLISNAIFTQCKHPIWGADGWSTWAHAQLFPFQRNRSYTWASVMRGAKTSKPSSRWRSWWSKRLALWTVAASCDSVAPCCGYPCCSAENNLSKINSDPC